MDVHHRLIWSIFADDACRRRDFLWRRDGKGRFFTLSHRRPQPHALFETPEVKAFAPALASGDRLSFILRANATRDRARATQNRRVDLVMDLMKDVPLPERASARPQLAEQAANDWFARQGSAHGFRPTALTVESYTTAVVPRQNQKPARFGFLDLSGSLEVLDPIVFSERLGNGFGRARAFGCGLMLIRRA